MALKQVDLARELKKEEIEISLHDDPLTVSGGRQREASEHEFLTERLHLNGLVERPSRFVQPVKLSPGEPRYLVREIISKVLASMPIRKSISAAGQRAARQSALKLFTDRNHERELLRHFFERLARVHWVHDVRPEKPILSIWGVGGIGKTKLLEKATEDLGQRLAGLRLISLDLDHDRWTPSSSVAEFFWHLRSRLWEAKPRGIGGGAGIETPLFDYLYFALWRAQHPGENFALNDSVLKDLLSTSTLGTTILAEASAKLAAGVSDVATAGGVVGGLFQLLGKALTYLRNRDRKGLLINAD